MSPPEPTIPQPAPINVKPHLGPVVLSETTKALVSVVGTIVAFHLWQSDAVAAAVFASAAVLVGYAWGLAHRIRCWINLRFLANQVPDEVAKVGK